MCNSKTATCMIRKPDEGCPIYRYFKGLIIQNYNKRLKADMVAMLAEIQLEIEEMPIDYDSRDVSDLIQQKINALKTSED